MNPKRIAKLLRERAALDLELAEAFEEQEPGTPIITTDCPCCGAEYGGNK